MRFRGSPGINKNRSVLRCYGTVFLMSVLLWHTKRECINLFTTLNVKECRVDVALFSEFPQVRLAQPDSRQKDSIISVLLSRLGAWLLLSRVRRSFNPSSECILRNVLWRTRESCQSRTRDVFSAFGNLNRRKCRESESISGKRFWLFPMGRGGGSTLCDLTEQTEKPFVPTKIWKSFESHVSRWSYLPPSSRLLLPGQPWIWFELCQT